MKLVSSLKYSKCIRISRDRTVKRRYSLIVPIFVILFILLKKDTMFGTKNGPKSNCSIQGRGDISQEWNCVIRKFMEETPQTAFLKSEIEAAYEQDKENMRSFSLLVNISRDGLTIKEDFKGWHHGRASSVKYILSKIYNESDPFLSDWLPEMGVLFLVSVNDCSELSVASFCSARHWDAWKNVIPAPLGNNRGYEHGWGTPLEGWDKYIYANVKSRHYVHEWSSKIEKGIFRGVLRMQAFKLGTCNSKNNGKCQVAKTWKEVNRGVLYIRSQEAPELFDVGFNERSERAASGEQQMNGAPQNVEKMTFDDYQKYKYIINVGSNQDWAERLRTLLFTNSAVIIHEAETKEFFTPLLRPWIHYIPTNLMFTDLVKHIRWAKRYDRKVQSIVEQSNKFADTYISESSMEAYWKIAIKEFSQRQRDAEMDNGSDAHSND